MNGLGNRVEESNYHPRLVANDDVARWPVRQHRGNGNGVVQMKTDSQADEAISAGQMQGRLADCAPASLTNPWNSYDDRPMEGASCDIFL
jgi:hypothetical protein